MMAKMAEAAAAAKVAADNPTPTAAAGETQPEENKKSNDAETLVTETTTSNITTTSDGNKDKPKEPGLMDLKDIDIDELYDKVAFDDSEPQLYDEEEIDKKER